MRAPLSLKVWKYDFDGYTLLSRANSAPAPESQSTVDHRFIKVALHPGSVYGWPAKKK
jgi:hypothetical protein